MVVQSMSRMYVVGCHCVGESRVADGCEVGQIVDTLHGVQTALNSAHCLRIELHG